MSRRRRVGLAVGATLALAALGTFEWAARQLVRAPGTVRAPRAATAPPDAQALRIEVGPPAATLDVWVFEPDGAPRGTAIALHGLWHDKRSRRSLAQGLRDAGARAVLVDLRAHGASTGDRLRFGAVEGRDLAQVLDALDARGLVTAPVVVHGTSYGGAVAHQLAGRDPRVRAVVTVAAFADFPGLVRPYAALSWPWLEWALPDVAMQLLAWRAARHGGFELADTDVLPAVRASDANRLLFHGDADRVVPFSHAERIAAACGARCELVRLAGRDHRGAMRDRGARRRGRAFLRAHLSPAR